MPKSCVPDIYPEQIELIPKSLISLGEWRDDVLCPGSNELARAAIFYWDPYKGAGDDTGAHGLKFLCKNRLGVGIHQVGHVVKYPRESYASECHNSSDYLFAIQINSSPNRLSGDDTVKVVTELSAL